MGWPERNWKEKPEWLAAFVILVILIIFVGIGSLIYEQWTERRAREAILSNLSKLSSNASVTIEGEARQQTPILEALKGIQDLESHHSYPLRPLQVVIRDDSRAIELVVAQDSERPDEYWVFRPGANYHNNPLGEYLGRIETQVFRDKSPAVRQ
jgi:hypothetical protein